MSDILLSEQHGDVLALSINRPKVRNAIDAQLRNTLRENFVAADNDDSVRAIVISGQGGHFCAGGDIGSMKNITPQNAYERMDEALKTVLVIAACSKPVIGAIQGHAAGAGVGLALLCDEIIADPNAQFTISFSRIGLAPDWGLTATLPARIGAARARRLSVDANRVDAQSALAMGLIDEISASEQALQTAIDRAQSLANRAAPSMAAIKTHFRIEEAALRSALERERDLQALCFLSPEFAEGKAAFREKREPDFRKAGA